MAQNNDHREQDKRKRLVLSDDFVAEDKGKMKPTHAATSALEEKLREAKDAKELDCPPDFFTEPPDD